MPASLDLFTGGTKYLSIETARIMPGYVSDIYRDFWAYDGKYHKIATNLDIGNTSIINPQIRGAGKAVIWTGEAIDVSTGQWQIGATNLKLNMWAFAVTQSWLEMHQQEIVKKMRILPERDWVEMGMKIAGTAIAQAIHDRVIAGVSQAGAISENGLFRGTNITVIQETDNLYGLSPNDFYTRIQQYVTTFCRLGMLRPENIRILYPDSLRPNFAAKVSLGTAGTAQSVAGALLERMEPEKTPVWINELKNVLELDHDWLERLGVNPAGTNKSRMILQCDLPIKSSPFATRTPQIWRGERVIDRTDVERVNFQEVFIAFAIQSEISYDVANLALIIEFPKKP